VGKYEWLLYVLLAGLAWGTYVPIIFYGGNELGGKANARLMAIFCVGLAYFVIGVLFPLVMFLTGQYSWPELKPTGLVFASLAGVAGAVGAICVIFATQSAVATAKDAGLAPDTYKLFIAPLIFGLAPVINTIVSSLWHPKAGQPFHFELELPGWKLWLGILLVGAGAALVLFAKEEAESTKQKAAKKSVPAVAVAPASPMVQEAPQ
jgi:drug/metabolite transporter (DMT)-like permease